MNRFQSAPLMIVPLAIALVVSLSAQHPLVPAPGPTPLVFDSSFD